ncbi:MAG TPA: ParB/RepB/Spo0J family partition protein [Stellaceae bacterium]|nr:ParB/RepB/Spo0J family partition protein [Stellaceae bacterium]
MKVVLKEIKVDPSIHIRRRNHQRLILRYKDAFARLPPVDVFETPEGLLLADGFCRMAAAERLGLTEIEANVLTGSRADAVEHAVVANTKNGAPLTANEREEGIRRLMQLHPDWPQRRIAEAMSISPTTVKHVFEVDEIKRSVPAPAIDRLSVPHLREVAKAPKPIQAPLAEAAADRGWSREATNLAIRNLQDDRVPEERKRAILTGEADPVVVTPGGPITVPASIVGKQLREMASNDALSALERFLAAAAHLRLYTPEAIVSTIGQPRLDRLVQEIPLHLSFLEQVLAEATKAEKPRAVS